MDDIKNIIEYGIREEMIRTNNIYVNQIEKLQKEDRMPKLYEMIVEVYHNTRPQREITKSFLLTSLSSDFFHNADIKDLGNSLRFYNNKFSVDFPLSRGRVINITDLSIKKVPYFRTYTSSWHVSLVNLIEKFLDKKSFKNLKELKNFYKKNRKHKNFLGLIYNYYITYKECDIDKLNYLRMDINQDNERAKQNAELVKAYNLEKEESLEFAYSLVDLKQFQDFGWNIYLLEKDSSKEIELDYGSM